MRACGWVVRDAGRYHFVTLGLAKRTPQNKAVLGPFLMRLLDKLEAVRLPASPSRPQPPRKPDYISSFVLRTW